MEIGSVRVGFGPDCRVGVGFPSSKYMLCIVTGCMKGSKVRCYILCIVIGCMRALRSNVTTVKFGVLA